MVPTSQNPTVDLFPKRERRGSHASLENEGGGEGVTADAEVLHALEEDEGLLRGGALGEGS